MPSSRLLCLAAVLSLAPAARADEPLRAVIDRELSAQWTDQKAAPAPRSTDSEFLRRVYVDLVGTAPSYEEGTKFLADADAKKREKLIDALIADPRFAGRTFVFTGTLETQTREDAQAKVLAKGGSTKFFKTSLEWLFFISHKTTNETVILDEIAKYSNADFPESVLEGDD